MLDFRPVYKRTLTIASNAHGSVYSSSLLYSFEECLRRCFSEAALSVAESTFATRGPAVPASDCAEWSTSEAEAFSENGSALALELVDSGTQEAEAEEQLALMWAELRALGAASRPVFGRVADGGSDSLARDVDAELEESRFERQDRLTRGCVCFGSFGFPPEVSTISFGPLCLRRVGTNGAVICEEEAELLAGKTMFVLCARGSEVSRRSASLLELLALLLLEAVDDSDEVSPRSRSRSR